MTRPMHLPGQLLQPIKQPGDSSRRPVPDSADGMSCDLGIVVPLASEADTIRQFLDRVMAHIGPHDRVFCVLDNACKDNTRELIDQYARLIDARVAVVWAPENRCVVDAYFRGYRAAYDSGARRILEMDGGLSHRPEEIPRFVAAMQGGAEFAAGCRFMRGGSYEGPWTRYVISKGGTILTNLLLGTRMRDMTSGFECFSRQAMERVLTHGVRSRGHFFQTEIRYLLRSMRTVEVPINYTNPSKSVGTASLTEAFRILWALRCERMRGE